ncbi:MAG TPA: thioesterase family protein [Candidatus Dormibacteraeota bacterium]|nr:thioesterase family protein [Candidatus Dormibacteraeota bacterium]
MPSPPNAPALFLRDGDLFVPTVHTRGPWDPRAQHGGPPAALLARCIDGVEAPGAMRVVRVAVDILRPVPLTPLRVTTRVARPGRRVDVVEAALAAGDTEVARCSALRVRSAALDLDELAPDASAPAHTPDDGTVPHVRMTGGTTEGFPITGSEMRFISGGLYLPGPSVVWIRLRVPVVEGETPTPMTRAAAAADFGNGVSSILDWEQRLFINPDLGVWLSRDPVGEWICLEASTRIDATVGAGLAESALWDRHGRVGRSVQSLFVESSRPGI